MNFLNYELIIRSQEKNQRDIVKKKFQKEISKGENYA